MKGFRWAAAFAATVALSASAHPSGWLLIDLGTLGGPGSYGAAVSDNGYIAGCSDAMPSGVHAFVWHDGVMRDLGTASDSPAGNACGLAVNNAGVVAGRSATGELVVWDRDGVKRLGIHGNVAAMNDGGAIVGSYQDAGSERAFLYRNGVLTDLGARGGSAGLQATSFATSVNARDDVVGSMMAMGTAITAATKANCRVKRNRDIAATAGASRSIRVSLDDFFFLPQGRRKCARRLCINAHAAATDVIAETMRETSPRPPRELQA